MVWRPRWRSTPPEERFGIPRSRDVLFLKLDDPALQAYSDGVGPVVSSKFGKNVTDVALHGFFGERELCGDYFVRVAPRDQLKYIDFSWGQCIVHHVIGDFG